jgi:hypothetical protein
VPRLNRGRLHAGELVSCLQYRGLRQGLSSLREPQGLRGTRLALRGLLHIQSQQT